MLAKEGQRRHLRRAKAAKSQKRMPEMINRSILFSGCRGISSNLDNGTNTTPPPYLASVSGEAPPKLQYGAGAVEGSGCGTYILNIKIRNPYMIGFPNDIQSPRADVSP